MRLSSLTLFLLCGCAGMATIDEPDAAIHDAGVAEDAGHTPDAGPIDAGVTDAGIPTLDAGIPTLDAGPSCSSPDAGWICSADGTQRDRCVDGHAQSEVCSRGCLRPPPGTEASCLVTTDTLSCPGSYGTVKSTRGDYFLTAFGCWVDANGTVHTDSGDNCIPTCLDRARSSGLCMPGDTGPQCEQRAPGSPPMERASAVSRGCASPTPRMERRSSPSRSITARRARWSAIRTSRFSMRAAASIATSSVLIKARVIARWCTWSKSMPPRRWVPCPERQGTDSVK